MRNHEKEKLQRIIMYIKYMQVMKYDKYAILNNLDRIIEKFHVNASNDFIKCLFDIHQKIVLDKEIKKEDFKI